MYIGYMCIYIHCYFYTPLCKATESGKNQKLQERKSVAVSIMDFNTLCDES